MTSERIEKNIRQFWLTTCGIDTHKRSANHARLDTPWNAFTADHVLVCTLWVDAIATVLDADSGKYRQFVRIGGKRARWKGHAVTHGKSADGNLKQAMVNKYRVVGYEAEPDAAHLARGERKVKYFYMDRGRELQRIMGVNSDILIERLKIKEAFDALDSEREEGKFIEEGHIYELVEPKGKFPGRLRELGAAGNNSSDDAHADSVSSNIDFANNAITILIAHVLAQRDGVLHPITYLRLAELINRRNANGDIWARGMGSILGLVTKMVETVTDQIPENVPYLTSIVVDSTGKDAGLPGTGVSDWWPGYQHFTRAEKEAKVAVAHQQVLAFGSKWNDVLKLLGFPPVGVCEGDGKSVAASGGGESGGWAGGESDAHKALKEYVLNNPQIVGADAAWQGWQEYPLLSGDQIDVFFRGEDEWVGVEVKSSTSEGNFEDYRRGLFQVVKYKAVLNAQAKIDRPFNPPKVRVYLVLEGKLPLELRETMRMLEVSVMMGTVPT